MDDNGYPDDVELERIRRWDPRDLCGLMAFARSLWKWPQYWTMECCEEDGFELHRAVTGGWSGNEEIISALMENAPAWLMCWQSSHRGGKHMFEVRRAQVQSLGVSNG